MNLANFKLCSACRNSVGVLSCEACHFTGFMTLDDKPASVLLGENAAWKKKEMKKQRELEKLAKKSSNSKIEWFKNAKR